MAEENSGLIVAEPRPINLSHMQQLAVSAAKSGMFAKYGKGNEHAAFIVIQFGFDLGLSPTTALTSIHFIEGKPTMSGNLMWTLVKGNPDWEESEVEKHSPSEVTVVWKHKGQVKGRTTWNLEKAKRAELVSRPVWKKYPEALMFNRCVSEGFKLYCPHLGKGYTIYTPDELGAEIDGEGEIADGSYKILNQSLSAMGTPESTRDLKGLLSKAGMTPEDAVKALKLTSVKELEALTDDEWKRLNNLVERKMDFQS